MHQGVQITTTIVTDSEATAHELSAKETPTFNPRRLDKGLSIDLKRPSSYDLESQNSSSNNVQKIIIGGDDGLSLRSLDLDADSLRHDDADADTVDLEAHAARSPPANSRTARAPTSLEPAHPASERRRDVGWRDML